MSRPPLPRPESRKEDSLPEIDLRELRAAQIIADTEAAKADTEKMRLEVQALAVNIRHDEAEAARAEINMRHAIANEKERLADSDYVRYYTFHSEVNKLSAAHAVEQLGIWSRRDPGQPMTIVFNSPGGSVFEGLAFYDYMQGLRRAGHHLTTKGTGMAASMGGILLQAGDERVLDQNAFMLIHEVSGMSFGNTSEQEDQLKFTKRLQERLLNILAERSTLSAQQIQKRWKKTDWWLDANEALKLGFVDRVE